MTRDEWRARVGALVLALWPPDGWPETTLEEGWKLIEDPEALPVRYAEQAVRSLSREGLGPVPRPGVVVQRALAAAAAARPPEPDPLDRALTPEEIQAGQRWLPRLQAQIAGMTRAATLSPSSPAADLVDPREDAVLRAFLRARLGGDQRPREELLAAVRAEVEGR